MKFLSLSLNLEEAVEEEDAAASDKDAVDAVVPVAASRSAWAASRASSTLSAASLGLSS